MHVNDEKRIKLYAKSEAYVFIGSYKHSKYYKFYNSKTHKKIISKDSIFLEGGGV